jgi:hypothetical protein
MIATIPRRQLPHLRADAHVTAMNVCRVTAVISIVDDVCCGKAVFVAAAVGVVPAMTGDNRRGANTQAY